MTLAAPLLPAVAEPRLSDHPRAHGLGDGDGGIGGAAVHHHHLLDETAHRADHGADPALLVERTDVAGDRHNATIFWMAHRRTSGKRIKIAMRPEQRSRQTSLRRVYDSKNHVETQTVTAEKSYRTDVFRYCAERCTASPCDHPFAGKQAVRYRGCRRPPAQHRQHVVRTKTGQATDAPAAASGGRRSEHEDRIQPAKRKRVRHRIRDPLL